MKPIGDMIEKLENSTGRPLHLSDNLCSILGVGKRNARLRRHVVPNALGGDMNAAVELLNIILPGWGWRMATCCVSDDAWLFPDYNDPSHGKRLLKEFDDRVAWFELSDVDLRPPGRPAIALLISMLKVLEVISGERAAGSEENP